MKSTIITIVVIFLFFALLFTGGFYGIFLTAQGEPTKILDSPAKLSSEKLWFLIQKWRISQRLQPYIKNQNICKLANLRLPEIMVNFSHEHFLDHSHYREICPQNNCLLGENLSMNALGEQSTLTGWLNSPEHLKNLKANYQYSCIACSNSYCVQEFANF